MRPPTGQRVRGFRVELDPNDRQRTLLVQHAGAARFAYNWGLAQKISAYAAGEKTPSAIDLHRALNALKKNEFPWMYASSKCAPQEALRDVDRAYANFFRRVKAKREGATGPVGFPKFKSKHRTTPSFRLTGRVKVTARTIQLPRLGALRLKEHGYLPVGDVKILAATVNERAGRWFVALQVELAVPAPAPDPTLPLVGVDLGLTHLATLSDGPPVENPRWLRQRSRKLARLQRAFARTQKGSANRRKAARRVAIAHYRVACTRSDALHKLTTDLAKTKSVIVVEDLRVSNMLRNHRLARSIADASWGEFRRQLAYKTEWYGSRLIVADAFYPSTKRCSSCGTRKDMPLSKRTYDCAACSLHLDRDLNAARNLASLAVAASSADTSNACGGDVRLAHGQQSPSVDRSPVGNRRRSRTKQEPNTVWAVS